VRRFAAGGVSVPVDDDGAAPGPATLAVRPHDLRIVGAGQGLLDGVCKRVAYLGSRVEYVVATAWGDLLVFEHEKAPRLPRGTPVGVAFDPDAAIVLPR
jgi:ABC-type Fe3+/spermidine/putrescine transport system ATPase subunit